MEDKEYIKYKGLIVNGYRQSSIVIDGVNVPLSEELKATGKQIKQRMNVISLLYFMVVLAMILGINALFNPYISFGIFLVIYGVTMVLYTKFYHATLNQQITNEQIDQLRKQANR